MMTNEWKLIEKNKLVREGEDSLTYCVGYSKELGGFFALKGDKYLTRGECLSDWHVTRDDAPMIFPTLKDAQDTVDHFINSFLQRKADLKALGLLDDVETDAENIKRSVREYRAKNG